MMHKHAHLSRNLLQDKCQRAQVQVQGGDSLHQIPVLFSNDGKWMFVCCGSNVEVYSQSSHRVVCTLRHSSLVTAVVLNPRNLLQLITSSMNGEIRVWDYIDNALLKTLDFGVPLLKFGIRPGEQQPSIFFVIEKTEMVVVAMSSHVITERSPSKPLRDQLLEAQEILTTSTRAREFKFTHQGRHLVTCSGSGRKLMIYDLENENLSSYKLKPAITSLAVHPSKFCVATGHKKGEIQLWHDFAGSDSREVVTILHWHAHDISDLCFTTDGTYLLSGSEEGVLVLWQLKTSHKQFRPRLGSAISRISCSPGDSCFAVSLQSNVIQLVSGLNSDVEGTLGGLRKASGTSLPGDMGMKTGLVVRPYSMSLVLNSTPGLLQFYDTDIGSVSNELNVTGLNYVSRPNNQPLVPTTVDHVAFSPAADWMSTVESRDDGKTSPELRMKMWKFETAQQKYVQNTCVDPPHDKAITSLTFHTSSPSLTECSVLLAVTTSLDGKFKTWVLVDNGDEEEEKEASPDGGKKSSERKIRKSPPPSWACRSVGYYHRLPCMGSSFSEDGSLLALNFDKSVTVWDPMSCEMRHTFSSPQRDETFSQIQFGRHSSSYYLMASGTHSLHVWDLLSCRLLWRVGVSVSYLTVDPFSFLAAAFVWSKEEDKTILYMFDPSSPAPLAVHSSVTKVPVIGATFLPLTWETKALKKLDVGEKSTLFFIDKDQIIYSLSGDTSSSLKELVPGKRDAKNGGDGVDAAAAAQKAFSEIIGHRKRPNGIIHTKQTLSSSARLTPPTSLVQGPPHVLPPPTSLCTHFMRRILPASSESKNTTGEKDSISDDDSDDDDEERIVGSDQEDELGQPKRSRMTTNGEGNSIASLNGKDTYLTSSSNSNNIIKTGNYDWLVEYFKSCAA